MSRATTDEPMIGIPELARRLDVAVETVYDWRKHKRGPLGYNVGGRIKFRWSEVEQWLQQRKEVA
jgi:predicted DNA-binding transcriptional regulator AlpA